MMSQLPYVVGYRPPLSPFITINNPNTPNRRLQFLTNVTVSDSDTYPVGPGHVIHPEVFQHRPNVDLVCCGWATRVMACMG